MRLGVLIIVSALTRCPEACLHGSSKSKTDNNDKTLPPLPTCGKPKHRPNLGRQRIFNGMNAIPNSWPWQVQVIPLMRKRVYFDGSCGGSILYVGEILHAYRPSEIQIFAGKYDLRHDESGEKQREAIRLYPHKDFNPVTRVNDIAVIILHKALEFTDKIDSICPPTPNARIQRNKICVATGWGFVNDLVTADILQQTVLQIRSTATCQKFFGSIYQTKTMICAGDGTSDTCRGDSGGPFQCQEEDGSWTLDAVTSFGKRSCSAGMPSIYTRTSAFVEPWLNQIIQTHPVQ